MTIANTHPPRIQIDAGAAQTVFTYNFRIFEDIDLIVYLTPAGGIPSDTVNILLLTTEYTVQGAGDLGGGTITLVTPATINDTITIVRRVDEIRASDFTQGGDLKSSELNSDLDRDVAMNQDISSKIDDRGITYEDTAIIPSTLGKLPKLGANQFWKANATADAILSVTITENPDASTLRSDLANDAAGTDGSRIVGYFSAVRGSETVKDTLDIADGLSPALASQVNGSDGADLVGYYDASSASGKTVAVKLDELSTAITDIHNVTIGGDFSTNPFQRGTSFTNVADGAFIADRFRLGHVGTYTFDASRSTDSPTVVESNIFTPNSLLIKATLGAAPGPNDFVKLVYPVEGYDFSRVAQRQFTVSFWIKASNTGIYTIACQNGVSDRSVVSEYTINLANTWEFKEITFAASPSAGTWDYTNGLGLQLVFTYASGANFQTGTLDTWQVGDKIASNNQVNGFVNTNDEIRVDLIQIEEGISATNFDWRNFGDELFLCQRYYEKSYDIETAPATITTTAQLEGGFLIGTNGGKVYDQRNTFHYKVTKRDNPTVTLYSPTTGTSGVVHVGTIDIAPTVTGGNRNNHFVKAPNVQNAIPDFTYQLTSESEI